jgi:hypothetical protein
MSEKNWSCKYTHHGRRNGERFPRHALKDFEGTHISMGMLRSYKSKYSWGYRNYPAITSKYIIGLLDKYVGKSYDDFKLAFDQRTKNFYKKYPIECCKISDYLFDKPTELYRRSFYLDKNNIIRRCKKLKYRTHNFQTLSKIQKHFNERVKLPEWGQVRTDSRFDVNNDPSYINNYMPDKFREPLLLGTFYVVVNEKVCKLPVYTCNKEIFKTYSTYRDEKWDSEKRRYIKTPFWKSDAWNCKLINPAKRKKIAEQWIPVDVYTLPKLKHDFWCEAKHKDRYNLEERIENLNNKINTALDFNIRLELIGDRNKLIHQLNELPETACYNLGYGRYYPFVKVSDYEKFCNK